MEEANKLKTDINELDTELSKLELILKNQNIEPWQGENLKDEVSQLKVEIKQLKVDLEEKSREIKVLKSQAEEKDRETKQLKVDLEEKGRDIKVLKSQAEEKDREIKILKNQVEDLSEKLRKFDMLSTYRDAITCFKVFLSEKLGKVNKEMNDWSKIKIALRAERYRKNPKKVTRQLENVLKSLGLTYEEFDNLLELKHTSNTTFHLRFNLENLPEIKSRLKHTQFPKDWKSTKQVLTKIMGPLEEWLLQHEEPVMKTYDEYLVEKSKKSTINISLPEARKPNEGIDESKWKDLVPLKGVMMLLEREK